MTENIIRQIKDIQAQAERLVSTKGDINSIRDFSKYNEEIKTFLIEHVNDDFILKFVKDIPRLDINDIKVEENFLTTVIGFFSGGLSSQYRQNRIYEEALNTVRDIRGKYASAEFMLKNYFN